MRAKKDQNGWKNDRLVGVVLVMMVVVVVVVVVVAAVVAVVVVLAAARHAQCVVIRMAGSRACGGFVFLAT